MIIKTGKINKSRGNISLTIGKEDVKKHNLEEGDFVILTPQEYEDLKASSEIEVSTLEVVPDDEAVVIMVDSNIQREDILPSEKAKAYSMKYEAMKHQGKKAGMNTLDKVGEAAGENAKKVQRYIWLSRLSDELLAMVDKKKLGFSQGVDISFLSEIIVTFTFHFAF